MTKLIITVDSESAGNHFAQKITRLSNIPDGAMCEISGL